MALLAGLVAAWGIASAQTPPPANTPLAEFVKAIPVDRGCHAFLYAEPDMGECAIRLEVLIPLATIDGFVDVVPEGATKTTWDERQGIRGVVAQYIAPFNRVIADGKPLEQVGADADFFYTKSMWMPVLRDVPVENTIVSYVARYRAPSPPKSLAAEWHLFGEGTKEVRLAAIVCSAEPAFGKLTPEAATYEWTAGCSPAAPQAAIDLAVGDATVEALKADTPKADAVVRSLLLSVYRAFEQPSPSAAREAMARALDASLLDSTYALAREGLHDPQALGAVPRVNGITIASGDLLGISAPGEPPTFRYRCAWKTDAVVAHWGHEHKRPAGCEAVLTIAQRDGAWYVAKMEDLVKMP